MYNELRGEYSETLINKLESRREDLLENIPEWERDCFKAQSQMVNINFKILQNQWLMLSCMSSVILNNFNSPILDVDGEKGTFSSVLKFKNIGRGETVY